MFFEQGWELVVADDIVNNVQAACVSAFCGTWEFGGLCPGCAAGAEVVRLRAAIDALLAGVDVEHRTRADGVGGGGASCVLQLMGCGRVRIVWCSTLSKLHATGSERFAGRCV
jgi:hypothetical protein